MSPACARSRRALTGERANGWIKDGAQQGLVAVDYQAVLLASEGTFTAPAYVVGWARRSRTRLLRASGSDARHLGTSFTPPLFPPQKPPDHSRYAVPIDVVSTPRESRMFFSWVHK